MTKIKSFLPLPKCITIKPSKLHGLGLFATEDIAQDVELGLSHLDYEGAKDGFVRMPLGGFVNHSQHPNVCFIKRGKEWYMITTQAIKKGEEVTVDYSPWYDPEVLKTYN